jgi:hypothetical protein
MHVTVEGAVGAPKSSWDVEVAEERFMSGGLVASVLGSVVEASAQERRDITWSLRSRLTVAGHGTVDLEDFGVAIGGSPDGEDFGRTRLVRAVGDVLNNPWALVRLGRIESVLKVSYTRDLWRLRGADLLDAVVDAGEKARIRLHLFPLAGPEVTKVVDLAMPRELEGKEVEVEIVPGYAIVPDVPSPDTFSELLANEPKQSAAPRSVVLQVNLKAPGVLYRRHVAPRLPDFALDALRPASTDIGPDPFTSYVRNEIPLERYLEGRASVKVRVRPVVR